MPVDISESGNRLIAKFAYHPGAVEMIKTLPGATFSRHDRSWSISKRYAKRMHQTASDIDALLAAEEKAGKAQKARLTAEIIGWVRPKYMEITFDSDDFTLRFSYDTEDIAALTEMVPTHVRWPSAFKIPASSELLLRDFLIDRAMKIVRNTLPQSAVTKYQPEFRREFLNMELCHFIKNVEKLTYGPFAPTS